MISEQLYTFCIDTDFCKNANWTWCTDSGVPPWEGRGARSPTQREVVCLNPGGSSVRNALPRSAQHFRSCLWQGHLPSAFTRPAKSLADWAHQNTAVCRALRSMRSWSATGVKKCNTCLGNAERHIPSTLSVLLCVSYVGQRVVLPAATLQ